MSQPKRHNDLPRLAPDFTTQTPESFAAHVSSLHAEPARAAKRPARTKLKVKIERKPKKRGEPRTGLLSITLGSLSTCVEFTGEAKGRIVTRHALVSAALALRSEERPLETFLASRYAVRIAENGGE